MNNMLTMTDSEIVEEMRARDLAALEATSALQAILTRFSDRMGQLDRRIAECERGLENLRTSNRLR